MNELELAPRPELAVDKRAQKRGPKPKRPEPIFILVDGQECVKIPLTKGMWAIVDKADASKMLGSFWQAKAYGSPTRQIWYASRRVLNSERAMWCARNIKLHQMLIGSLPLGFTVDHKNGDGLDNRRCNLRIATLTQNQANARLRRDSKTSIKGVSFRKAYGTRRSRYVVRITRNGKRVQIGSFQNPHEAAAAYDKAALEQWGDFARINQHNRATTGTT